VSQFCTGPAFRGVCTPLNGTSCTNTPGIQSLILNPDADCLAFPCVPTLDSRCGGVGWPACGNPSTRWFSIYSTFIFTISYSIVCNVNIANPSSFDHEPPPTRPVQGQAPRGSTELLDPSSRKVASGQSSHPNPSNRTLRPHPLHTTFCDISYSIFSSFSYSTARDRILYLIPIIHSTATRITDPKQEPISRDFCPSTVVTTAGGKVF
jgi:hypothetical protein